MANLETLELTINGSAEKAGQGIDSLISRLSSLSNAITKPYSDLRDFNSALKETAKLAKSINFKSIGKSVGNSVAKGAGLSENKKIAVPTAEQIRLSQEKQLAVNRANALPPEALRAQQDVSKRLIQNRMAETTAKRQAFEVQRQAVAQQKVAEAVQDTTKATTENKTALSKIKEGFGNMTKGASTFFSKVKRIATTMLIRAAIRGLIRDMKEGVNNLYEWSKLNNGEFAKSFDTLKAKGQQLKNSLGAAIAPAIQAAIPVINALTSAAISAFNWVNQLIALLSGQSYWTKATDNVDAYTDSVNKAGGAAKEWIASFDELNVMTSGGGGGGGGASGITSDMFENTTKFSDSIREVADFIKRNFEDIKLIAEGIGVAILSWKLASGFLETLPALSKLAGLIGVGATIAITLKANYMLTNQYLETGHEGWLIASALTSAIGSVAAGVIAKKVFGGKVAGVTISFGLIMSALTDVIANVQHTEVDAFSKEGLLTSISAALKAGAGAGVALYMVGGVTGLPLLAGIGGAAALTFIVSTALKLLTTKNNIEWGSLSLTEDQIQDYVTQRMFKSNINVLIDQINVKLNEKGTLQESIISQIGEVETQLNVLSLGIDKAETFANLAKVFDANDENSIITKIKNLCNINIDMLKLTFANIEMLDSSGNAFSADTLMKGIKGWQEVEKSFEEKGKLLTDLLAKGAKGKLTPKMEEYTKQLLQEVTNMSYKIASAKEFGAATVDFKEKALDAMSKGSFEGIISAFKEYSDNYETTIRKALKENIASWYALADLTDDPEMKAEYMRIANELQEGLETTVAAELKKQTSPGVDMIKEWLFGNHEKGSASVKWTEEYLRDFINNDGIADTLKEILLESGFNQAEINIMDMIDFSGWDFLKKDMKKKFLANVKIDDATIKELSKAGVSAMELVELVEWDKVKGMTQENFIKSMTSAFGAGGIDAIKHRFPDIKASQVVKFSGWQEFTDTQKLEFIDAIGKAFGNSEAITAAKTAGIDLEKAVKAGMDSQNEDIRKMAEKWANLIGIEIKKGDYTVEPKYSDSSVSKIPDKIKKTINSQDYLVYVTTRFNDGSPKNISDGIDKLNGKSVPIKVTFADGYGPVQTIEKALENFTPKAKVEAELTNGTTLKNQLKKALSTTITLSTKDQMLFKMQLNAKAGGGLVNSGDMFIANENGVPEMIGRFGNQTGVANTGQIVEGISRGVADANEQQNALLREQNTLLRAIYEKDSGSGFPGANSALGRQIKRSLDAYNGLVGG